MEPDSAATTVDLRGQRVGNSYILVTPVGEGATGTVWRAVDRSTGAEVAVKLLHRDLTRQPKSVARFVQERAILLMLRHPCIVRVHDLLTAGDSIGLVMDLVTGGSLREYLRERGTLRPAVAAALLAQVADALAEAHRLNVVHRDLKPDNILLADGDGAPDGPAVRLTDFGIARVLDAPGLTTPEALIGTPNYLAPEVVGGARPTPAVDVYALGIVLYELVVGRPPFAGGPPVAVVRRHLDAQPHRYPGIPDGVWSVIESCLAKDPARRPHAAELGTTLRSLARLATDAPALPPQPVQPADGRPSPTRPSLKLRPAVGTGPAPAHPSLPPRARPRPRRNRPGSGRWVRPWLMAVLVAAALAGPGLPALHLLYQHHRPAPGTGAPAAGPGSTAGRDRNGPPGAAATTGGSAPAGAPAGVTASLAAGLPVAGRVEVGVQAYGPWQCADNYQWDIGHPVLAKPCYAVGAGIRVIGHMQAVPGVQADVSLTIEDADSGETAAGPYTCGGLMFTDFAPEHECGPFDLTAVPHGHRYAVVEKWQYTGRGLLPGGSARGPDFSW